MNEDYCKRQYRLRSYVLGKKKCLWEKLKEGSSSSRTISTIVELRTYWKSLKETFIQICNNERLNCAELETISELFFPTCEHKLVEMLFEPYFLAQFTYWRIKILDEMCIERRSVASKKQYQDYLHESELFFQEIKTGHPNINHLLDNIFMKTGGKIVISYVNTEMETSENDLRCTWYQDTILTVKAWFELLKRPNVFDMVVQSFHKSVIRMLTSQIYRIVIVDFPKKYRTILTLKYCMKLTNNFGRDILTRNLINDVEKYLLLASVDTKIILNAYASCVESLKELDGTCVMMHKVCGVMKEYLKKRNDTVQQIISYITSDKKEELEKDMSNSKRSAMMDEDELKGVNDEFLPENMCCEGWAEWEPHPSDASLGEGRQGRQGVDVFNMLVSVYGSKEMFVKEYRSLLAERLSSSDKKDPAFEKRYLELLKLRFQYSELQHCEVMLRDVQFSASVDEMVQVSGTPVSACIISSHYWPKIEMEKNETPMPEPLEKALKTYAETFKEFRGSRELHWMRGVGVVELEIELEGVRIEKTVTNLQAAVLYLLLEKESWTVSEVSEKLGISNQIAKRRLEWWAKQGLLVANVATGSTTEAWSLTKNMNAMASNRAKSPDFIDDEDTMLDDSSDMIEALEQYWSYTQNYIANHAANGEVKAERMHRVYRMFGSPTSAGPTLDHVNTFLQRKVQLGLLTFSNGFYRVVSKTSIN